MDSVEIVANKIRNGVLDINVQELFFSILIKGLLYKLNNEIKIRDIYVPHFIMHTGDDRMWIEAKGYDASIEPLKISNEQAVYSIIPKCFVIIFAGIIVLLLNTGILVSTSIDKANE